jgi:hypothetical protein
VGECFFYLLVPSVGAIIVDRCYEFCTASFEARRADALGGQGKPDLHALDKDGWLYLFRHILMHHRAVPVPLDVRIQTLQGISPRDLANAGRSWGVFGEHVTGPSVITIEVLPNAKGLTVRHQVDERVPEANPLHEVNRQVNKVVRTSEALRIQHF